MKENNKVSILNTVLTIICSILTTGMIIYFSTKGSNNALSSVTKSSSKYYLSGTVVDGKSNNSIGNAKIFVIGRNEFYYTQNNGNFKIAFTDSINEVRIRVTKDKYSIHDQVYNIPDNVIIPLDSNASN